MLWHLFFSFWLISLYMTISRTTHISADSTRFFLFMYQSVQLLSHGQLFVTPWTAAPQASLFNPWFKYKYATHIIRLKTPSVYSSIKATRYWKICQKSTFSVLQNLSQQLSQSRENLFKKNFWALINAVEFVGFKFGLFPSPFPSSKPALKTNSSEILPP